MNAYIQEVKQMLNKRFFICVCLIMILGGCVLSAEKQLTYKDTENKEKLLKLLDLNIEFRKTNDEIDILCYLKNDTEYDIEIPKYYVVFNRNGHLNRNCFIIKNSDGIKVNNSINEEGKLNFRFIWSDCIVIKSKEGYKFEIPNIQNSYEISELDYYSIKLIIGGLKSNTLIIE